MPYFNNSIGNDDARERERGEFYRKLNERDAEELANKFKSMSKKEY
jgi:hypothetical protein